MDGNFESCGVYMFLSRAQDASDEQREEIAEAHLRAFIEGSEQRSKDAKRRGKKATKGETQLAGVTEQPTEQQVALFL